MANEQKINAILDAYVALVRPALSRRFPQGQGRRAIDGGAHVGKFTERILPLFRHVEMWEPNPRHWGLLSVLKDTHAEHCVLRPWALGDERATVTLANAEASDRSYYYTKEQAGVSEMRALDDFAFQDVDLIKLNIEGAELLALRGSVQTIRASWPTLLLEDKGYGERFGYTSAELQHFLTALGYQQRGRAKRMYLYTKE